MKPKRLTVRSGPRLLAAVRRIHSGASLLVTRPGELELIPRRRKSPSVAIVLQLAEWQTATQGVDQLEIPF